MKASEFCYWLQGYFEISGSSPQEPGALNSQQSATIQRHLALVFKHDLDPQQGTPEHQASYRSRRSSSDEFRARMREQYGDVFESIEVLCKHFEAYRRDDVSICWGNGITLRVNGVMQAGGINNVAKWILEHSEYQVDHGKAVN
jgi:hypothetical protein